MDREPFIWTLGPVPTPVETGEFDDLGVVEEIVEGYHSLVALRVTALPVYAGDALARGLLWQEWSQELLYRQTQFLVALHPSLLEAESPNPTLRTLDLRYVAQGDGDVALALLVKAFDPDAQRSRWWARTLADEVLALFPPEYGLQPVVSEQELARYALRLDEVGDGNGEEEVGLGWWLGEIRRYEEFVPLDRERQVREQNYLVYPFTWRADSMSQVVALLHCWPGQAVVSVALRPTCLHEAEERHLCDLHATFEKLEQADWLKARIQGRIGQRIYAGYLRRLKRPYLMRVRFAGRGAEPDALVRALGESLPDAPPLPYPLLERWEQSLTAAERDAAGRAVRTVLEGLRRAGQPAVRRPHLPTPTGPLLERLEQAIVAGETVTITYYTASRDHVNTRRISPLRLEWRGAAAYCIAYCHLRDAERVFRVDRIQEIQ